MSIQTNIQEVRQRIAAACGECGRDPKEITLVGASKMNDAAACREAIAAGIDVLGENRVQEMTEKLSQNAYDGAPLHFIGHLQRNKVKQVVGKVALIQSVGSLPLLEAVEKEAEKQGHRFRDISSGKVKPSAARRPRAALPRRRRRRRPFWPVSCPMSGSGD